MPDSDALKYSEKIRVLVVDDSSVIRRFIMTGLMAHPEIEVIGTCENGLEAIADIKRIKPDLVTLDIEMPVMDGLTALREIRQFDRDLPIIMFSSQTHKGAEITLDALTLGASDYVGKPTNVADRAEAIVVLNDILVPKIKELCRKRIRKTQAISNKNGDVVSPTLEINDIPPAEVRKKTGVKIDAVCIGISTGGPAALVKLFAAWKTPLSVPIFIVQHMPPKFTEYLSQRLSALGSIVTAEPFDGEIAVPGRAYMAPGGKHMELIRSGTKVVISLNENPPENSCRPAVDVLFRSAAKVYGASVLGVVMTGMGYDGLKGAKEIVHTGGQILAQDEQSSVVWGMPGAVVNANLPYKVVALDQLSTEILLRVQR